jgi:hypothetical protein
LIDAEADASANPIDIMTALVQVVLCLACVVAVIMTVLDLTRNMSSRVFAAQ